MKSSQQKIGFVIDALLDPRIVSNVELLLKTTMGLSSASVGVPLVIRAISARMDACEIDDAELYYAKLVVSAEEQKQLIELVVIPETWFFRDKTPFVVLQRYYQTVWSKKFSNKRMRLLSVPCSTGEEPYTLAMALLMIGISVRQFSIDGIDISAINIGKAKQAAYTQNSFRGNDLVFRDRFFTKEGSLYQLKPEICSAVNFKQGNILASEFMSGRGVYDVIFCRNLLIYFDKATQEQALKNLGKLLRDDGILFVGHAETGALDKQLYASAGYPRAFAFHKNSGVNILNNVKPKRKIEEKPNSDKPTYQNGAPKPFAQVHKLLASQSPKTPSNTPLLFKKSSDGVMAKALALADGGQLAEAAKICENVIKDNGPNAQAYYLMGLADDVAGNGEQAREYLRKAIYLDPNAYDALIHLATLEDKQGNLKESNALRQRAQRVSHRNPIRSPS